MTDKQKLNKAFRELRKKGYKARQRFTCCGTCGHSELGEFEKYAFTTIQDDDFNERGTLISRHHIKWYGDGKEMVKIFEQSGFDVDWDGSEDRTIILVPPHAV